MLTPKHVQEAISEFWNREAEYYLMDDDKLISALPANLLPVFKSYPLLELVPSNVIYRSRLCAADYMAGSKKELVENYSYAPLEYAGRGRAHILGETAFYGSEYISATAFESRQYLEDQSLLGCWQIKDESRNLRLFMTTTNLRPEIGTSKFNRIPITWKMQMGFLDKIFTMDREKAVWTQVSGDAEEQKASEPNKIHKVTSVIAKHLVQREGADGIVWRSAQAQGSPAIFENKNEADYLLNLAIWPDFVDEHMELKKVYKIRINPWIDDDGRNRATREVLEIGIPDQRGRLNFSELSDEQSREYEANHNTCGVPFKLEGESHLTMTPFSDIQSISRACDGVICAHHDKTYAVKVEDKDGVSTTTIICCCDEYSDELIECLKKASIWQEK